MCSLINKQLLLTAYAYLFIMEQQKGQQGSEALQLQVEQSSAQARTAKLAQRFRFMRRDDFTKALVAELYKDECDDNKKMKKMTRLTSIIEVVSPDGLVAEPCFIEAFMTLHKDYFSKRAVKAREYETAIEKVFDEGLHTVVCGKSAQLKTKSGTKSGTKTSKQSQALHSASAVAKAKAGNSAEAFLDKAADFVTNRRTEKGSEKGWKWTVQDDCNICRDPLDYPTDIAVLPCGHIYHHESCIAQWFVAGAERCPTCRKRAKEIYLSVDAQAKFDMDRFRDFVLRTNKKLPEQTALRPGDTFFQFQEACLKTTSKNVWKTLFDEFELEAKEQKKLKLKEDVEKFKVELRKLVEIPMQKYSTQTQESIADLSEEVPYLVDQIQNILSKDADMATLYQTKMNAYSLQLKGFSENVLGHLENEKKSQSKRPQKKLHEETI